MLTTSKAHYASGITLLNINSILKPTEFPYKLQILAFLITMMSAQFIGNGGGFVINEGIEWPSKFGFSFHGARDERIRG